MMMVIAHAGLLSGFPGLESVPGPELPKIDSLSRFNGITVYFLESLKYLHKVQSHYNANLN